MRRLKCLVVTTPVASAVMLAQSQNPPAQAPPSNQAQPGQPNRQTDNSGPTPSTRSQSDRASNITAGSDSPTCTATIVNVNRSQASILARSSSVVYRIAS